MSTTAVQGITGLRALRTFPKKQLANTRVLVRVDVNVEMAGRTIRDTSRIVAIAETVKYLCRHHARVILVAHRGRPDGRDPKLSLAPLVPTIRRVLGRPIHFIRDDIWSDRLQNTLASVPPGDIAMLENIRYEAGEAKNSSALGQRLAGFADLAVNDAFADSHRAHASIVGVSRYIPMVAGFLLERELSALQKALSRPKRPYVAVIGGAKISTKLQLVENLIARADAVLLGGALANTVLKAEGVAVGASLIEPKMIAAAGTLRSTNAKLHIPIDVIVRGSGGRARRRAIGNVGAHEQILDIGPDTVDLFARVMKTASTIVWNGPMGVYEQPPYNRGTRAVARLISARRGVTVAGGGETVDAIKRQHLERKFTVISTGGGAMLEWLEGKTLPGVAACMKGKRL